jgi:hypothetical protein
MDDVELMEVGDATDDLLEEATGLGFWEFMLSDDVVEELALLDVLHHQEEMLGGLDDLRGGRSTS